MSKIVIEKEVSLDFLGELYKNAFIVFQSIPAIEYEHLQDEINSLEKNKKSPMKFMVDILKRQFIRGEFPVKGNLLALEASDLDGLDADAVIGSFKIFTGQALDPKAETPSTNISPMAASPQENS